jgi:putative glutamine amidotransferase
MKAKPLVLIAPATHGKGVEFSDVSVNLSECYPRAIIAAGGAPGVLSCTAEADYVAEIVRRGDGIMLTGGDDVQPQLYAGGPSPELRAAVGVEARGRDLFELLLIREVFRQQKPLLAICRGQQMLNVALGGTLVADIASQWPQPLRHQRFDRKNEPVHEVSLREGSRIRAIFGQPVIRVNSTHHQAIERLAGQLQATATSPDGVIEAVELAPAHATALPWLLSVQFHPERLWGKQPVFLQLFRAFVEACSRA